MSEREPVKKPNLNFLRKVESGAVKQVRGYTTRRGGYTSFHGGEASYRAHLRAGYVNPHGHADLGRPAIVTLTELGRKALEHPHD